jgi:hypothetical protein
LPERAILLVAVRATAPMLRSTQVFLRVTIEPQLEIRIAPVNMGQEAIACALQVALAREVQRLNYATPRAFARDILLGAVIKALPNYHLLTLGTMEAHARAIALILAIAAI